MTNGDPIGTAAAQTVAALSTQLQAIATNTPVPSNTPQVIIATSTQQPGTPTEATATKPCDRAEFVDDVTVEDGTVFKPGETFTKTWRLKNTGSCTWTTSYRVVFDSAWRLVLRPVSPAHQCGALCHCRYLGADEAPTCEKDYESYWKALNPRGTFGLGQDGG